MALSPPGRLEERGHGAEVELLFYLCHGLLHLLGYDDHTPEERDSMLRLQATYLAWNRTPGRLLTS